MQHNISNRQELSNKEQIFELKNTTNYNDYNDYNDIVFVITYHFGCEINNLPNNIKHLKIFINEHTYDNIIFPQYLDTLTIELFSVNLKLYNILDKLPSNLIELNTYISIQLKNIGNIHFDYLPNTLKYFSCICSKSFNLSLDYLPQTITHININNRYIKWFPQSLHKFTFYFFELIYIDDLEYIKYIILVMNINTILLYISYALDFNNIIEYLNQLTNKYIIIHTDSKDKLLCREILLSCNNHNSN